MSLPDVPVRRTSEKNEMRAQTGMERANVGGHQIARSGADKQRYRKREGPSQSRRSEREPSGFFHRIEPDAHASAKRRLEAQGEDGKKREKIN